MDQPWENAEHEGIVPSDEFASFLEFNGMNNMQFELEHGTHSQSHHSPMVPSTSAPPSVSMQQPQQNSQFVTAMAIDGMFQHQSGPMPYSTPQLTPGFEGQDSSSQQYMASQPMIPPTPNSIELQANAARYPHRVDETPDMYDRYQSRVNEEQALYTPLVSPAMTPLESQFRLPEYTILGEYFTPLTSPALEAQNSNNSNGYSLSTPDKFPMSGLSQPVQNRKVKQSPSIRAQTQRRGKPLPSPEEFYNNLAHELNKPPNHDRFLLHANPPAITPLAQSPGFAATPATLMRISRSQHSQGSPGQFTGQAQLEYQDEMMEDISLPEAATGLAPRPKVNQIDTSVHTGTASPVVSANGTPSLEPRSGALVSPRTAAMPSPSGPVPRGDTSRASISSRKRPSVSSTQASPQLRPKISPNIQPLMRGAGLSQDALYLASKSNYQHILDGTLPSGVSYPETLAENLSSKRTNHKLAEQGRRNRINSALKEIESLIPPEFIQARQAKEAAVNQARQTKEAASNQNRQAKETAANPISKASAVEMAIDYIKDLQQNLQTTTSKLAALEAQLRSTHEDGDASAVPPETAINGAGSNSEEKNSSELSMSKPE
ncbi:hypothetical protein N7468_003321 [Penicillium chermesinum]|uniref:BHLH domain-containing protein n=1 Tax=Penicillium chermesinum TaxID=63820 RepID=A0A9W9TRP9_9EURO|nr:uncharacterized protein N7468_003321 [Penicillium chermesinum]KAJ5238702.1 hypothetical protein N7468_003321 [Penicillium chermesinum]